MRKTISFQSAAGLVAVTACIATIMQAAAQNVPRHPVSVVFMLPSNALPQLRASLEKEALDVIAQEPDGRDIAVGRLTVVDNQIDPITGGIAFKATFGNANGALQPGQTVNVRVVGYTAVGRVIP